MIRLKTRTRKEWTETTIYMILNKLCKELWEVLIQKYSEFKIKGMISLETFFEADLDKCSEVMICNEVEEEIED